MRRSRNSKRPRSWSPPPCRPKVSSSSVRRASAWGIEPGSDSESDAVTDTVLVVDFGAQYARLIARRVREAHVYSEIVPSTITVEEVVARAPKGIIFSGGHKSVYGTPAHSIDPAIYELGIPI